MQPVIIIPTLFICFFLLVWLISTYNKFIKYQNRIEESWSSIDIALKRRFNLVPNLVSVIKGYEKHEGDILDRNISYTNEESVVSNRVESESKITNSLSGLLALAEAYPDLKASVNFLELQKNLADIEEDIQARRVSYNNIVGRLNTLVESFPANFIASRFGFEKRNYFTLDLATQRELPLVEFERKSNLPPVSGK